MQMFWSDNPERDMERWLEEQEQKPEEEDTSDKEVEEWYIEHFSDR